MTTALWQVSSAPQKDNMDLCSTRTSGKQSIVSVEHLESLDDGTMSPAARSP